MPGLAQPEHADSGGVDQPLASGRPHSVDDVERPAHVDLVEDPRVAGPEPVHGREVERVPGAFECGPDGPAVADVDDDALDIRQALQVLGVRARLDESHDLRALSLYGPGDSGADEAGCTGDHDPVAWLDRGDCRDVATIRRRPRRVPPGQRPGDLPVLPAGLVAG